MAASEETAAVHEKTKIINTTIIPNLNPYRRPVLLENICRFVVFDILKYEFDAISILKNN